MAFTRPGRTVPPGWYNLSSRSVTALVVWGTGEDMEWYLLTTTCYWVNSSVYLIIYISHWSIYHNEITQNYMYIINHNSLMWLSSIILPQLYNNNNNNNNDNNNNNNNDNNIPSHLSLFCSDAVSGLLWCWSPGAVVLLPHLYKDGPRDLIYAIKTG